MLNKDKNKIFFSFLLFCFAVCAQTHNTLEFESSGDSCDQSDDRNRRRNSSGGRTGFLVAVDTGPTGFTDTERALTVECVNTFGVVLADAFVRAEIQNVWCHTFLDRVPSSTELTAATPETTFTFALHTVQGFVTVTGVGRTESTV